MKTEITEKKEESPKWNLPAEYGLQNPETFVKSERVEMSAGLRSELQDDEDENF